MGAGNNTSLSQPIFGGLDGGGYEAIELVARLMSDACMLPPHIELWGESFVSGNQSTPVDILRNARTQSTVDRPQMYVPWTNIIALHQHIFLNNNNIQY